MEAIKLHVQGLLNLPGGPLAFTKDFLKTQWEDLTLPAPGRFAGQTIIVTGANVGLGLEASRHFVRLGAEKVILACRNAAKGAAAQQDIEASTGKSGVIEVWPLDLGSFESVQTFAQRAESLTRLDAVVENAGIAIGTHVAMEGFESTITTNVVSPFLLAVLLLPKLRKTAAEFNTAPHVVFVSSDAHVMAAFNERNEPNIMAVYRTTNMSHDRYNVSKLLEVLLMRELDAQLDAAGKNPIVLNALNPGFCKSDIGRHIPFPLSILVRAGVLLVGRTTEMGSRTLVTAACGGLETKGQYMDSCRVRAPGSFVTSPEGASVQKQVYAEMLAILEDIQPGIGSLIVGRPTGV